MHKIAGRYGANRTRCSAKVRGRSRLLPRPGDPGREYPVEERLHEAGAEEVLALLSTKLHAEGLFEGPADRGNIRRLRSLDQGEGFARIRGQHPGHVLRARQRRRVQERSLEVLEETVPLVSGRLPGVLREFPERGLVGRQAVGFQLHLPAQAVAPDQEEVMVVGDEHLLVAVQVIVTCCRPPAAMCRPRTP